MELIGSFVSLYEIRAECRDEAAALFQYISNMYVNTIGIYNAAVTAISSVSSFNCVFGSAHCIDAYLY